MSLFGGRGRIRTAVDGFAIHCLATRPRDHFFISNQNPRLDFFSAANI